MKASSVLRAVIDTNVLISAALSPKGSPAKLVRFFIDQGCFIFSVDTFDEFSSRIWKPKFDAYISRELRKSILQDFSNIADWVEPTEHPVTLCRDADDNKFLDLAIAAKVDMLVSGDADLTVLKKIDDIPILTPAECLVHRPV